MGVYKPPFQVHTQIAYQTGYCNILNKKLQSVGQSFSLLVTLHWLVYEPTK